MTAPNRLLLLIIVLLRLPVLAVEAQMPVFKIEDQGGTTLLLVNDDGTITLPQGATNGFVLTTDANGNATWQAAPSGGGLTLPFSGTAAALGPAFSVENTGAGPAGQFETADDDGVVIPSGGSPSTTLISNENNGVEVQGAEGSGLFVGRADQQGVFVVSAGGTGMAVGGAGNSGVSVDQAGNDGVLVNKAGSPTTIIFDSGNNGFAVRGAEDHGLFVGQADQDGVRVESAGLHGVRVVSADIVGVRIDSAGDGVFIDEPSSNGVLVDEAGNDGFHVNIAGSHGFEVGQAGGSGVRVNSANFDGVEVLEAGADGVRVVSAAGHAGNFTNNSSDATLRARQDGTGDIVRAFAGGNLRFRVHNDGDVTADGSFNGGGADLAEAFAVEGPTTAYEPGDVLVISDRTNRTVERATDAYSTRVAGVYATKPGVLLSEAGSDLTGNVPMGVVGVIPTKVSAENGPIRRGDLLVTAATPGHAMKAEPEIINGKPFYPTGTILGKALAPFDGPGTGVIEVLVNVK